MVSNAKELRARRRHLLRQPRRWLWTYSGQPRSALRRAIGAACKASDDCAGGEPDARQPNRSAMSPFAALYEASRFCAMPGGTTPSRHALFHAFVLLPAADATEQGVGYRMVVPRYERVRGAVLRLMPRLVY
eukprot:gene2679-9241_t